MTTVLLGIPLDRNSSFSQGPSAGPAAIRAALASDHWNRTTELGVDLDVADWRDGGDVDWRGPQALEQVRAAAGDIAEVGDCVLALGGDHSVSAPLMAAAAERCGPLTVLHVDAHPDLYADFQGNPHSHASPFARALEAGSVGRLIQVGVRTINAHQADQAARHSVEVVAMRDWPRGVTSGLDAPLYVSIDVDALDPAHAPGVSHNEPGGLTVREVLRIIHALPVAPVAADVVELNPLRDIAGVTATAAAKIVKELLGRMVEPGAQPS